MLDILYEDNHLLAINKPAGMLTQPSPQENESLETITKEFIKTRDLKPGNVFLGTVHRLDRPASGIVLFAKTSKALSRLNELMRDKQMKKIYCALIEGALAQPNGTLKHYLKHDDHRAYVGQQALPEAKLAILHYKVLQKKPSATLVEVNLETGRYHQIRAQFAAIGCPLKGDVKYGSKQTMAGGIIALHHQQLDFLHPVTKAPIHIEAPLPKHFTN